MRPIICILAAVGCLTQLAPGLPAQEKPKIAPGSKVYINPINGFETYLAAGLEAKKIPVTIVHDRTIADFEITGIQELDKEEGSKGWVKVAELGLTGRHTGTQYSFRASLAFKRISSGETAFAYSVVKGGAKAQQSAAEAFAKHLKEKIVQK